MTRGGSCAVLAPAAGVDEVGRGPLAGPVVAAAVILDPARPVAGLKDSKLLTARQRRRLAIEIRQNATSFALGYASSEEIDSLNILAAALLAMERAVRALKVKPALVRVDGNRSPAFSEDGDDYLTEAVVRGDRHVDAISAASILAKVCRDRLLARWDRAYPAYGFSRNKGYPTREHLAALEAFGPCRIHRKTFAPVRAALGARPA
jgi:ribonuclease HII